jgi:hypothetical protein
MGAAPARTPLITALQIPCLKSEKRVKAADDKSLMSNLLG